MRKSINTEALLQGVPEGKARGFAERELAILYKKRPGWLARLLRPTREQEFQRRVNYEVLRSQVGAFVETAPINEVGDLLTYVLEERIEDFSSSSGSIRFKTPLFGLGVEYGNELAQTSGSTEYRATVGIMLEPGMFERTHIIRSSDGMYTFEREFQDDFDPTYSFGEPKPVSNEAYIRENLYWAISGAKNGYVYEPAPANA